MEAAEVWVGPLGDPAPAPDLAGGADDSEWGDELRRDLDGGEGWVPWATERMIPAAQAAFRVAGLASGVLMRVPLDRAWEVWATEPDEVRPVVAAILPVVPRTPLARFVISRLPGAAAIVQGAGLALDRIRATRELRAQEGPDDRADRQPRPDRGDAPAGGRPRFFGVGSVPLAEQGGAGGGRGRRSVLDDDEWSVEVARPDGVSPDGTLADPALLRRLVGGHEAAG